jgi:glycosyltransferase involved in cell wall biosynthesis
VNNPTSIEDRILPYLIKLSYPFADDIIAISKGVSEDLAEFCSVEENRIKVIYNPAITPAIADESEESISHQWFTAYTYPVILGVGRLMDQKDFSTLIKAFRQLLQKREARLVILGEGEKREELEELTQNLGIEEKVDIAGFKQNPFPYMKNADVFVLSSVWEGFGNVLVEAMACGTPVVSMDCPSGPAEILENGKYGPLVPPGDSEALVYAILDTLDSPIDSELLKERANDFEVEKISSEYEEFVLRNYESIAKQA